METLTFRSNNSLKLLSYNVNGLNNVEKLVKIRNRFLKLEDKNEIPDIYTFQEAKGKSHVEIFWNNILPGKVLYSHNDKGPGNSRGIILGFTPGSKVQLKSSVSDKHGRYIVAECAIAEEKFTVASVYLEPSLHIEEFRDLLSEIASRIAYFENNRVIWVGDFNVALSGTEDCSSDSTFLRASSGGNSSVLRCTRVN